MSVLQLIPGENQMVLISWRPLFVRDLGLYLVDLVRGLDVQDDRLTRQCLSEDLIVGVDVGEDVGAEVGEDVGDGVVGDVGDEVGGTVGVGVGQAVGAEVGGHVGVGVGGNLGAKVGKM